MMPRLFILIYILCLSGATFNHARDLWRGGWLPYNYAAPWENAFWTALTFIDPLAIALLLWRPRWGVWLTLALMLADVAVNLNAAVRGQNLYTYTSPLLAQVLFLGFVLGSAPWLLSKEPS